MYGKYIIWNAEQIKLNIKVDLRKKSRTFLVDGEVVTDFEVVFRKFYRQLYLYAYNFVMDEMEAEDIVQETFSVREKIVYLKNWMCVLIYILL